MTSDDEQLHHERLQKVLENVVPYVTNEALLLAQFELLQEGKFARLWPKNDNDGFNKRMEQVEEHLGGPPRFYVVRDGEEAKVPPADNYPHAAMQEAVEVFERARKSVVRANVFMTGSSLLAMRPDLMELPKEPEMAAVVIRLAEEAFWEHAEAAFIRLSSFWDRIGQLFDFAFFNIRKFDQNGFSAVMDRVHNNVAPMDKQLKDSSSWKRLRTFQTSEEDTGLKWLLQRRNLIVHSLHLHPVTTDEEGMFKSQFNHLDAAHREKLRPRDPDGEVTALVGQLDQAGSLFAECLSLVLLSRSRKIDTWLR